MTNELELPSPPPPQPIRIEDLPDSNLIKQAVMKHRKQKDKDNENN